MLRRHRRGAGRRHGQRILCTAVALLHWQDQLGYGYRAEEPLQMAARDVRVVRG